MKKTKKVLSFLLLSAFLMANIPLSGVHAADLGGMDVFPESEITAVLENGVLNTKAVVEFDDIYQLNLEFENETGDKVVVWGNREGSTFTGERPTDSFITGGNYRLTRVFGRLLPSAEYSFSAEQIGKELTFSVDKENVLDTKETVVELSSNEMYDEELLSITIDLPFEPYNVKEIKGSWKFLDKQEGDADYYSILFMNNWGMKYNKELGLYEADLWISGRPEGRYELEFIEIESWSGDETIVIYSSDAKANFNADYTFKGFEGVDVNRFTIKDITAPVKYGDTVKFELDAGEGNELVEKVVLNYLGVSRSEYTIDRDTEGMFKKDIYIHRYSGGTNYLKSIEAFDKDGNRLGYTDDENGEIKNGNIIVDEVINTDDIELKISSTKSLYTPFETIEFEVLENIIEKEYFNYTMGEVKFQNLDNSFRNKENPNSYDATSYAGWNTDELKFWIESPYGMNEDGYFNQFDLEPGRYVATEMTLRPMRDSYDWITIKLTSDVLFTVSERFSLEADELYESEDKRSTAHAMLNAIEKIEDIEERKAMEDKYYGTIQDILKQELIVEVETLVDVPKYVFNSTNLSALNIIEAMDVNTSAIEVKLEATVLSNEEIVKYSAQMGETKDVIGLYDLSLMKTITNWGEEVTTSKIENEDIKGLLTLRLPVPVGFKDSKNLKVIYITAEGVVEELETKIVVEGENTYLEFQTDHFSTYGIIEDNTEVVVEEPVVEEPVVEEPVVEEPVVEEPVVDSEVIEAEVGEEVVVVAEEGTEEESEEAEKTVAEENEKLVKTGTSSTLGYSLSGVLILGAGLVLLKKEEGLTVRAKR